MLRAPCGMGPTTMHPHPAHEAPVQLQLESAGITRRQVLATLAASAALANGACSAPPNDRIYPYVDMPEAGTSGLPRYYASAVVRDGFAHGVLVGTKEGRPIKVEGNPLHPSSLGATDVFVQAAVLQLWDPDRAGGVKQRLGQPRAGALPHAGASSWPAFETAWQTRAAQLGRAGAGARLHVLTGPLTSPTERALLRALVARYPGARAYMHAPVRDSAAVEGMRLAFGRTFAPVLRLERGRCIVGLAADPFTDGPGAVRDAMDWARARAAGRDAGRAPQLFAVDVAPTLFGTRADRRLALPPARIERLLQRLASTLLGPGGSAPGSDAPTVDAAETAFESRLVEALRAAGPDALVLAGRGLSAHAHALVMALNQRLGAIGRTLSLIEAPDRPDAPDAEGAAPGTLAELVQALNKGRGDTLVILGGNPVYDAPAALEVAAAIARVGFSVHAGLHADETSAACEWHLPLSHDFERWGDARAHDGSVTLLQPAIAPLYDSRSPAELLALLAGDLERSGHALVQRHWQQGREAGATFDAFWRESLRRGVVDGTAFDPVTPPAAPVARLMAAAAAAVEPAPAADASLPLLFLPDPAVHDGQFANVGWLQELPRPFSKMTWDNALQLGPRTAEQRQLRTGDKVRAQVGSATIDVPVWVDARHAEQVATLTLGQGRRRAGRVGTGVGIDAYRLLPASGTLAAVTLQRTDARHAFAVTQHELGQGSREIARTLAPGERIAEPGPPPPSLYPEVTYDGPAWGMAIDLDTCIGCNACTIACQAENNIPVVGKAQVAAGREMHWIRVDTYAAPEIDNTVFQPLPCMHCEKAPCELVCPVGATVHDSEGLNVQVYNRCIGTRFCSNNCPYKVRRFNFLQFADEDAETLKAQSNPDVTVRQRGVMEKCTYCVQRVARARHHVETTGRTLVDGDVVTACQSVCPTRAIHFGNLNDPAADVVRVKASPRHYALLGELNTQPRTTYLARVSERTDGQS
ncbi:4Fe-4S dicluster domain-containing protein [Rhizobacter fulvus]